MALGPCKRLLGGLALLQGIGKLAQAQELVAYHLVVLVECHAGHVALGHLKIAHTLGLGAKHGAHLAAQALAQVFERCAHDQAALGEGRLGAAIHNLQEELAHCRVDGIAHQVGVERLEYGLARQYLGSHGSTVGHARAAYGLDQALLDHALFHVERELAGSLLRSAPPDAVREARNVFYLFRPNPFSLLWNWSRRVVSTLSYAAHVLYFL